MMAHAADMAGAMISMVPNLLVSRYAVAPGMISMATTRITPTACSATTEVSANSASRAAPSKRGLSPMACAWIGSKA
eukprot:TRINITY_DN23048_c0_g1_i1.p2 TRINITY_DN23048_c0_g1~~TRINITY_DN23048_c0_g1_i1.p2  ORF type:complete len:77 (-),score=0.54 TRINITY_DN23048_c0_g1_i1:15-245(-)